MRPRVQLEKDEDKLQFTNSLWEIQKIKSFKGGEITWNGIYRLRHVGSGEYLAVGPDKVELTLKPRADSEDTLFVFRREFYPNDSSVADSAIETGSHLFLESFFGTFMQTYINSKSGKNSGIKFDYKLRKSH